MEPFLVSASTVAIAEMGDRTQLLTLMLAAEYRKPWPILAGILCSTVINYAIAGFLGARLSDYLTPLRLDAAVGISMIAMALWTLKPDKLNGPQRQGGRGAFATTLVAFFIAEIGDKTQLATMALAAAYASVLPVVGGATVGMLLANAPFSAPYSSGVPSTILPSAKGSASILHGPHRAGTPEHRHPPRSSWQEAHLRGA
jgi:putative Ca2+/H+ antiporter (TMEM165/GDT1 family)